MDELKKTLDDLTIDSIKDNEGKQAVMRALKKNIDNNITHFDKRKGFWGGCKKFARFLLNGLMACTVFLPFIKSYASADCDVQLMTRASTQDELDKAAKKGNIIIEKSGDVFKIYEFSKEEPKSKREWSVSEIKEEKSPNMRNNHYENLKNLFSENSEENRLLKRKDVNELLYSTIRSSRFDLQNKEQAKSGAGAWFSLHGKTYLAGEKAMKSIDKAPGLQKRKS